MRHSLAIEAIKGRNLSCQPYRWPPRLCGFVSVRLSHVLSHVAQSSLVSLYNSKLIFGLCRDRRCARPVTWPLTHRPCHLVCWVSVTLLTTWASRPSLYVTCCEIRGYWLCKSQDWPGSWSISMTLTR